MVVRLGLPAVQDTKIYLKEWREWKGWTQQDLADRMDTTKQTVSRVESGSRDWSKGYLEAMAYCLDCEVPDLFRRPDQSHRPIAGAQNILETLKRIEGLDERGVEVAFTVITSVMKPQTSTP